MKPKFKVIILLAALISIVYWGINLIKNINPNPNFVVGQKLDSLNGVYVYYNGGISHIGKRNIGADGYNIGLTFQCVEFAKRYYYQFYNHKMPDAYGNAKDFFDAELADGKLNIKRNLLQFTNPSFSKPCVGDLLVFNGHPGNPYGHVAIVSAVADTEIEIIQQNPGPFAASRAKIELKTNNSFELLNSGVLGWLRMK